MFVGDGGEMLIDGPITGTVICPWSELLPDEAVNRNVPLPVVDPVE
jgi:hypothetical protein